MHKLETLRLGIAGNEPLLNEEIVHEARAKFIEVYGREPLQLRVSHGAFNNLVALAERISAINPKSFMGMEIKLDYDMEDNEWCVCREEAKAYSL